MYKLLKSFWRGELNPGEHRNSFNAELLESRNFTLNSRRKLEEELTDAQKILLEKYEKYCDETAILENEDNFILGFSLGLKIGMEVFMNDFND